MPTELMESKTQELSTNDAAEQAKERAVFVPRTDIYESQEHLLVLTDMPGVKLEDVDITLEHNILTIEGKVEEPKFKGYNLTYSEYATGDYKRVFTLSNEIDREGIQASIKNGVLKLSLPKSKRATAKKITVQAQ